MKSIVLSAIVSLASTVTFASGFVCTSPSGYNVKMYNHVSPDKGTANPAALIVSHVKAGTLAAAKGSEIQKANYAQHVAYAAHTNSTQTGRFVSVKLEVSKQTDASGSHPAILTVNADNGNLKQGLSCARYLKN